MNEGISLAALLLVILHERTAGILLWLTNAVKYRLNVRLRLNHSDLTGVFMGRFDGFVSPDGGTIHVPTSLGVPA
ncbi:MAG TPA: hypothetical protein VMP08_06370 [Anaerolineae bacterium]|nr:hypothetical protein [Anaerolineae bacterium]